MARSKDLSDIFAFILYWSDEEYRRLHSASPPGIDGIDPERVLEIAGMNKLSYYVSKRAVEEGHLSHQTFHKMIEKGDDNLLQQRHTLEFISSVLRGEGAEFLIIKTFKGLPYYTFDLDVMVKESHFERVVNAFVAQGAAPQVRTGIPRALERRLARARGANLVKEGLLEIDVYQDTTWTGWSCLSNDFIWEEPRRVEVCGVECDIPNQGADLLLSLAHVIFCHGDINLLDFLYMNSLLQKDLDWEVFFQQAEKYGWRRPLSAMVSILKEGYQAFCQGPDIPESVSFPYLIPFRIIFDSYRGVAGVSKPPPGNGRLAWTLSGWLNAGLKISTMLVYRRTAK